MYFALHSRSPLRIQNVLLSNPLQTVNSVYMVLMEQLSLLRSLYLFILLFSLQIKPI